MVKIKNICAVIIISLCFVLPVYAHDGSFLVVDAPSIVPRGEPFIINIKCSTDIPNITVKMDDKIASIAMSCTESVCYADVLMPMPYSPASDKLLSISGLTLDNEALYDNKTVRYLDKEYRLQKITVEAKYVTPPPAVLKRIETEQAQITAILNNFTPNKTWVLPFKRPVPGIVSTEFGVRREFNGQPRRSHYGIDFVSNSGHEILSLNNGIVVLTGNHYFAGNSVYIDHGQGVVSYYMHMSKILVKIGDLVQTGDTIGLVGATGRVTGPHLHLGLSILGYPTDASILFNKKEFTSQTSTARLD